MATQQPARKVSYCTTCKGRLHHLKQTLPANMLAERDNPNVEFVVLDYGSDDGLGEWIHENFANEIASGRLRYARTEQPNFRMAHAKNMAHRLATGDILCNLDADNTIEDNYSRWIDKQFAKNVHACIGIVSVDRYGRMQGMLQNKLIKLKGISPRDKGICGRIILHRDDFAELGGYDESRYEGYGNEDLDLLHRAYHMGLRMVRSPHRYWGSSIVHSDKERHENMAPEYQFSDPPPINGTHPREGIADVGCGEVCLNFKDRLAINPLKARAWQPPEEIFVNDHPREPSQGHRTTVAAGKVLGTLSSGRSASPLVTGQ